MSERLAQAFVECATEYDWADLPPRVQAPILEAAKAMQGYCDTRTIVIGPVSGDGLARYKQLLAKEDHGSDS